MKKKTEFRIPFTRESIIILEPELKGHYVERKIEVLYKGYSLIQAQEVTPHIMESLLKRVHHSLMHLQEFCGETQWDITRDLIYQVSLLIYARFKNKDINKEEATRYSQELLGYSEAFNSLSRGEGRGCRVIYHPEYTQPESIEYFNNVLSMYADEYLDNPDEGDIEDGEEALVPISVILKREELLTHKLITTLNYHYDQILREIRMEISHSTAPEEDKVRIYEVMVEYVQDDMGFPDAATLEDFIECIEYSQRGQDDDIPA